MITEIIDGSSKFSIKLIAVTLSAIQSMIPDTAASYLKSYNISSLFISGETISLFNREKKMTVVLITHYMDEAVLADRVIVMDGGRVLTEGTPEEVFSQVELLKKHRLDVPQSAELMYRLRGAGVEVSSIPLNVADCISALEEVLR